MTNILKWSAISLVVAHFLNCACETLKTEFLAKFLEANLITLLIATLAINTATAGIILSRLSEMNARYKLKFPLIISAMKTAILEQLGLIIVATGFLILKNKQGCSGGFSQGVVSYWDGNYSCVDLCCSCDL